MKSEMVIDLVKAIGKPLKMQLEVSGLCFDVYFGQILLPVWWGRVQHINVCFVPFFFAICPCPYRVAAGFFCFKIVVACFCDKLRKLGLEWIVPCEYVLYNWRIFTHKLVCESINTPVIFRPENLFNVDRCINSIVVSTDAEREGISFLYCALLGCGGFICEPTTSKPKRPCNKGLPFQFPSERSEAIGGEYANDNAAECCSYHWYSVTNPWEVHRRSIPELLGRQVSAVRGIGSSYLKGVA